MQSERGGGPSIYGVLRNPIRRSIILHLYSNIEASAAELKSLTGVSYGTLYYHIDSLKPFLWVIGRGRFRLNEEGVRIARRLIEESYVAGQEGTSVWEVLALGFMFSRGDVAKVGTVGGVLLIYSMFVASLLGVSPSILHLQTGFNASSWVISILILTGYLLVAYSILRRGGDSKGLLITAVPLSYLPVALYLSILTISTKMMGLVIPQIAIQAGFIATHIWQLAILAAGLTHATGAGYEKSIPVVLLLSYLSLVVTTQALPIM